MSTTVSVVCYKWKTLAKPSPQTTYNKVFIPFIKMFLYLCGWATNKKNKYKIKELKHYPIALNCDEE